MFNVPRLIQHLLGIPCQCYYASCWNVAWDLKHCNVPKTDGVVWVGNGVCTHPVSHMCPSWTEKLVMFILSYLGCFIQWDVIALLFLSQLIHPLHECCRNITADPWVFQNLILISCLLFFISMKMITKKYFSHMSSFSYQGREVSLFILSLLGFFFFVFCCLLLDLD